MKKGKIKMEPMDFFMFTVLMLLVSIGIVMVYSASSYSSFFDPNIKDSTFYLKKQIEWAVLGTICMFIMIKIDYHFYKKYTLFFMIITMILLFAVFAFPSVKGAKRWIRFGVGSIGIQPSEIAKYVIVLYMAKSIENKGDRIKSFLYGVIPYLMVSGLYAAVILKEPNMSVASVIMIVTIIILFIAGAKIIHLMIPLGAGGLLAYILTISAGYRNNRLQTWLDPWKDPRKDGYQIIQSWLALGSGGITGVGLGKSRQKCFYIPEPHNDFIFSIIGEELGLIGCIIIIILFALLIWRGVRAAIKAKDTYGCILATGIIAVIAVQAFINIAVVTGTMPVTGVPLPFISYGGSSLLFNMGAMGILLNITRQT